VSGAKTAEPVEMRFGSGGSREHVLHVGARSYPSGAGFPMRGGMSECLVDSGSV